MKVLKSIDYSVAQKRKRVFLIGTLPGYHFIYPTPHNKKIVLRDALKGVPSSKGTRFSQKRTSSSWCHPRLLSISLKFRRNSWVQVSIVGRKRGMARRISWMKHAYIDNLSSQKQTERCHPDETRPFTIREYARIQSFPDEWEFEGSVSSCYKQIGNAVAVNVAIAVGLQVIEALKNPINGEEITYTKYSLKPSKQGNLFGDMEEKLKIALQNGKFTN